MTSKRFTPDDLQAPDGWEKMNQVYAVFRKGTDLVLLGNPDEEGIAPYDGENHNCDYMGCRMEHVILRAKITKPKIMYKGRVSNPPYLDSVVKPRNDGKDS